VGEIQQGMMQFDGLAPLFDSVSEQKPESLEDLDPDEKALLTGQKTQELNQRFQKLQETAMGEGNH
jgi:hypothetical protein